MHEINKFEVIHLKIVLFIFSLICIIFVLNNLLIVYMCYILKRVIIADSYCKTIFR